MFGKEKKRIRSFTNGEWAQNSWQSAQFSKQDRTTSTIIKKKKTSVALFVEIILKL